MNSERSVPTLVVTTPFHKLPEPLLAPKPRVTETINRFTSALMHFISLNPDLKLEDVEKIYRGIVDGMGTTLDDLSNQMMLEHIEDLERNPLK